MSILLGAAFVYPVKGCRGISLDRGTVERRGIRDDRRWMIVDEEGQFLTQRAEPRLALVAVSVDPEGLVLSAPHHDVLRVPHARLQSGPRRLVRVWRDDVNAADCGDAAAAWVSSWLGKRASLVFMPGDAERSANPKYSRPDDLVSFADGFPLLLASTSSLDDLNARLDEPVPMGRFRPNLVVHGSEAWAEDRWNRIRIGETTVLRVAKPCERCTVTTIDQDTAIVRGPEPLRTLATFRKVDNGVLFGQNCLPDTLGTICVGDTVTVLD